MAGSSVITVSYDVSNSAGDGAGNNLGGGGLMVALLVILVVVLLLDLASMRLVLFLVVNGWCW